MKVLHVTHTDVTDDSRIEKQLKFLNSLDGYAVSCIFVKSPNYNSEYEIVGVAHISKRLLLSKMKWLPRIPRHIINMLEITVYIIANGLRIRPSIVHAHDALVLPAATILSVLTGAVLIYDAHELESDKNGQTSFMRVGTLLIEKICWPRVDKFITVSKAIQSWYFKAFSEKDSEVILNSPVTQNFSRTSYLRERFAIDNASLIFIYIGYLSNGRGIDHILEAFSAGDNKNHVVFLGEGSLKEKVVDYSARFNNIHYHAPVPHADVVKIASSADVGLCLIENVSTSDYFSLPNKLFEYLFSGLKVIGSDFPEIKRIIYDYNAGVTCDNNSKALLTALSRVDLAQELKSVSDLSWNAQVAKLRYLYER